MLLCSRSTEPAALGALSEPALGLLLSGRRFLHHVLGGLAVADGLGSWHRNGRGRVRRSGVSAPCFSARASPKVLMIND